MESDLGAKVKKLRISHGLTQEDVAKALDVTPGYISNVENGRNLMTLRMLSYYAELTGVSLDYLAGSVDKSYQNTALDNEIMQIVQKLDADTKEKLISTLRIWERKKINLSFIILMAVQILHSHFFLNLLTLDFFHSVELTF